MIEHDPTASEPVGDLLRRLTDDLPATALPPDLLVHGRAVRHRRRRTALVGAVAAVVAVAAGGITVPRLLDAPDAPAAAAAPFPAPPPGTKWVGQGRAVVAVPQSWPVTDAVCWGGPDVVHDDDRLVGFCSLEAVTGGRTLQSVGIDTRPHRGAPRQADDVRSSPTTCSRRGPGAVPSCAGAVRVGPDVEFHVSVTGVAARVQVEDIVGSAMTLPPGWTTVPFAPNSHVEQRRAILEAAGLQVRLAPGPPDQFRRAPTVSTPPLGSPIPEGGTVVLSAPGG